MEKVLIIEDDQDYCILVERALTAAGFCVRSAGSMAEGLTLIREEHPDAVVLDLGLPDSPVDQSVERVKQFTQGSAIIVVLSGNSHPDAAKDCIMKSASGFISKDSGLKYLATEIRNAIRSACKIQSIDSVISKISHCHP